MSRFTGGYIKAYRSTLDEYTQEKKVKNILYGNVVLTGLWDILLKMAARNEHGFSKVSNKPIKPGQIATTHNELMRRTGLTKSAIRHHTERLIKHSLISISSNRYGILITIVNWERYQCAETGHDIPNDIPNGTSSSTSSSNLTEKIRNKENKEKNIKKKNPTKTQIQAKEAKDFLKQFKLTYLEKRQSEYIEGQWDTKTAKHIVSTVSVGDRPLLIDFYLRYQNEYFTRECYSINVLGKHLTKLMSEMKSCQSVDRNVNTPKRLMSTKEIYE